MAKTLKHVLGQLVTFTFSHKRFRRKEKGIFHLHVISAPPHMINGTMDARVKVTT
jgi:hypothetical protein